MNREEPVKLEPDRLFRIRVAAILCQGSYSDQSDTFEAFEAWIREAFLAEFVTTSNADHIHSRIITLGGQTTVLATLKYKGEEYLFIAFRGTYDKEDVICDLKVGGRLQLEGKVHAGFWGAAEKIPNNFLIECLNANQHTKVVVCGHSKGGAVAQLYTLRCIRSALFSQDSFERIFCVTFGSPLVGDKELSNQMNSWKIGGILVKNHFLNIVNQDDAVPCLLLLAKKNE